MIVSTFRRSSLAHGHVHCLLCLRHGLLSHLRHGLLTLSRLHHGHPRPGPVRNRIKSSDFETTFSKRRRHLLRLISVIILILIIIHQSYHFMH